MEDKSLQAIFKTFGLSEEEARNRQLHCNMVSDKVDSGNNNTNSTKVKTSVTLSNKVIADWAARRQCPLCLGVLASVTLHKGRRAFYCKQDRVTIPQPI